jgi:hypothetical protein
MFYSHYLADQSGRGVFARSNTAAVGSNPAGGMDICVRFFCVCAVLCVGRGLIPRPRSPADRV